MAAEQEPNPAPLVPPGEANQLPPLERITVWPKKLGIVSIIFAACSILASGLSLATVLGLRYSSQVIEELTKKNPAQKEFMQSPLMHAWLTGSGICYILCVLLALMLLICGVGLLRRRPWSVKGLSVWACAKLIVEIASTCIDYVMYTKVSQAIARGLLETENVPEMFQKWSPNVVILGLTVACALPIFVLIWLARGEIREETAAWH